MVDVSMPCAIPEVERQERKPETFVLRDVPELVAPDGRGWLRAGDDHVPECDRTEAALGQHAVRETAIADVKKAPIATPREREGQQP